MVVPLPPPISGNDVVELSCKIFYNSKIMFVHLYKHHLLKNLTGKFGDNPVKS